MRDSPKSILVWNLSSEFSQRVAATLANAGYRLLLCGDDPQQLDELDATLVQSELHRLRPDITPRDLDGWVRSQAVGMDHAVLFPSAPHSTSAWPPAATWTAQLERCLVQPLEVIRTLTPLLNRGKKPKHLVVALQWLELFAPATPLMKTLSASWAQVGRELAAELAPLETIVSALWFGPLATRDAEAQLAHRAEQQNLSPEEYRRQVLAHLPQRWLPEPTEAAQLVQRALEHTWRSFTGSWVDLSGASAAPQARTRTIASGEHTG